MDFAKVEARLAELIGQSRWADVYDTIAELPVESANDRAYAEIMHGLVMYQHNALELAREGLLRIDDGLDIADDPGVVYRGCLCGLVIARAVGNTERSAAYVKLLRLLMRADRKLQNPLTGRGLYSIAAYHLWRREYDKALKAFSEAVAWYRENQGPYNEHDRRCQIRLASTGLGEVCLLLGKRSRARAALAEAEEVLNDDTRLETTCYLRGLIASSEGRFADAIKEYTSAQRHASQNRDHQFRLQIVEMLAYAYRQLGHAGELRTLLEPVIEEAANAELPNLTLTLQRLAVFPAGEGVGVG